VPPFRVISFDLTGTLISPFPSLGAICEKTLRELGLENIPSAKTLDARKKQAMRTVRGNGFSPVSESASKEYWRAMLWEIFAGAVPNALFPRAKDAIYRKLSEAGAWKASAGAADALSTAKFLGLKVVALSNGDSRWRTALKNLGLAPFFDEIFLSSETGLAKPDSAAFDHLCLAMKIRRDELIHVGDSLEADIVPANALGIESVWLMRVADGAPPQKGVSVIDSLAELPNFLQKKLCADISKKHFPRSTRNLLALLRGLPEEQSPLAETVVAKAHGSETTAQKRLRTEEAAFTTNREFSTLSDIEKILRSRGIFSGSAQAVIRENWGKIVPAALAQRCSPIELRDGLTLLVIACENALVRQEIEFKKRTILKKIRALHGCADIKKIAFTNEFSS